MLRGHGGGTIGMASAAKSGKGVYYIEVVAKALEILDVFGASQKPVLTLHQICQQTKLNKNTVFRILFTLGQHGYVVKHGIQYQIGPRAADLAHSQLRRRDLLSVAGPELDRLRDRFGETVNLAVLDGSRMRYVDVRESFHRFRLAERIGGTDHLHSTALGKATLAFLPIDEVRRLLKVEGMARQTPGTIVTLAAFKAELAAIRERGYALDCEESMAGAFCVAAPILDSDGAPVAAVSISGPTTRFNASALPKAASALLDAAAQIRAGLGYAS